MNLIILYRTEHNKCYLGDRMLFLTHEFQSFTFRWNTVVHAENSQAKFLIAANKMRINLLRKNLAAIDKERKLNAQKRIRINRKPYTTESKENVQSSKLEKLKGSEENNHSQGQGDTEKEVLIQNERNICNIYILIFTICLV